MGEKGSDKGNIQIHEECVAHSGLNTKINIIVALSSLAFTAMITVIIPMLISIQSNVATNTERIEHVREHQWDIEKRTRKLELESKNNIASRWWFVDDR